jgi:hypothetical protein
LQSESILQNRDNFRRLIWFVSDAMKKSIQQDSATDSPNFFRWPFLLVAGCVLVILIGLLTSPSRERSTSNATSKDVAAPHATADSPGVARARHLLRRSSSGVAPALTAEEIVAGKLVRFAKSRRELVLALAKRFNVEVPDDVERFFEAAEAGRYEELTAIYKSLLLGGDLTTPRSAELHHIWRPIQETWGIAREAHNWPAQELLDYGDALLGSLKPGMAYVGGTDPGCFIPTFLNATSDGEQHVVLTQNALADGTYLDYLNFLYGDQLTTLTQDDSQRAFQDYIADVQERFQHDQQFPNEPKQMRPGENFTENNGQPQVSGQVAVMAINERLLQNLLQKNPDLPLAMEESFSLPSTYDGAVPLGPIMELRGSDQQNTLTADNAAQNVAYWRDVAQQLPAASNDAGENYVAHAYAHMAQAQANLFASQNLNEQAEQTYQIASTLWPDSVEALGGLSRLLAREGRVAEANQLLDSFTRSYPKQQTAVETIRGSITIPVMKPAN